MNKTLVTIGAGVALLGGGVAVVDVQTNPYTDNGDRVEVSVASDVVDAGEQKVELKKDKPEVRFKKWNGEVDLGLTYDAVKAHGNRPLLSNKMEYKDSKQEVHAYPLTEGFEVEVILNEKPNTNIVTFTLDGWENLDFFYQPELTQQEIDDGASRPENVVGSYAVYHKEKVNHKLGDINYATGKVGHIYRPNIVDSTGKSVWGELHIENGILTVTIPQWFLDEAVYPIHHAAGLTFGYTSVGATGEIFSCSEVTQFSTAPENGTITSISFAHKGSGIPQNVNSKVGVFTYTSATNAGASLAQSSVTAVSLTQTAAFVGVNVSYAVTASTNYFLAAVENHPDTGENTFWYDTSAGKTILIGNTEPDCSTTFSDPFSEDGFTVANSIFSIYATYTADAPAASGDGGNIIIFE